MPSLNAPTPGSTSAFADRMRLRLPVISTSAPKYSKARRTLSRFESP